MHQESSFLQVVLCVIASGGTVSSGMNMAFPAVALPAMNATMNDPDSPNRFTNQMAFLVASLPQITMVVGCLAAGPILDSRGRRLGLLLSTLLAFAGWSFMWLVPGLWSVYTGRLLTGLAMGLAGPSESVYVSEIASPSTRSALTVVKVLAFSIGVTLTYLFGFFYKRDWKMVSMLCGIFPAFCFLLILVYLPEPKVWTNRDNKPTTTYLRKEVVKPMIIMTVTLFLRQVSGTTAVIGYAVDIVELAEIDGDSHVVAIVLGVTRLVGGAFALWLSSRLGRRAPAIWSGVAMSICMLVLATKFQLPSYALVLYVLTSTVNGAVPQAMAAEVFPLDVRAVATSMTSITMFVTSTLALWAHQMIRGDKMTTFLYYGSLSVISTAFTALFLPETHGKTLQEIQHIFNKDLENGLRTTSPLTNNEETKRDTKKSVAA